MSVSVLQTILAAKREEVAAAKRERPLASFAGELAPSDRDFRAALAAPGRRHVFEVKKASPSRGAIRPDLDLGELLRIYERHADCISVLTDARWFGGSGEDLRRARALTTRPLLRKDFVVDPYQIAEARWLGADAVLLIVAALAQSQLEELQAAARSLEMAALVEVHDEAELDRALAAGADLVGINNRDLNTLSTDLAVTERLAPRIPAGVVRISESGVEHHADLRRLAPLVDGFLVGSSILAARDMAAQVKQLVYGRVKICGITRRADAQAALDAGASWLGFIFHAASPRVVDPEALEDIVRGLPGTKVGVFVDHPLDAIVALARRGCLHGLQLHGGYGEPDILWLKGRLPEVFVVRALPVGDGPVVLPESAADYLLLDSKAPGLHGGTGRRFDYRLLEPLLADPAARFHERVILAGGLNPDNVAEAAALEPFALDLSSGVESSPGEKDREKLRALFDALR
ncbi:MAG: bifunctional indole-3-glycerol-phosphate synthase TrpC/phosphoribosylanthranilate isomerase TrpF [Candidatus Krumholzibacteriia bacterium]|nr:bifunctional indole-3-glycerol-phosphate synthase TrpC/phosphoribosylanthranilate isomerase TrpF [bacterium]